MNIIAIIPARGGSKGIPNKNLVPFMGQPLLSWTIQHALACNQISETYVSSDNQAILNLATSLGAKGVLRPPELAGDSNSSEEALSHVLSTLDKEPDLIVFLQATSPLRTPNDIDNAINTITKEKGDSLFSLSLMDNCVIWKRKNGKLTGATFDPNNRQPRQEADPHFIENGSIYIFKPAILKEFNNRIGGKIVTYDMPKWQSHDIDVPEDLTLAEIFFTKFLGKFYQKKLSRKDIDLLVYDFDGVMTDNRVTVMDNGSEAVSANRADGLAISKIKELGIKQLILSTETNTVVQQRADKLNIPYIQACDDKKEALEKYCSDNKVCMQRTAFVGNDLNDLEVLNAVGLAITPSDAYPEALASAKFITTSKGGQGVIREIYQHLTTNN